MSNMFDISIMNVFTWIVFGFIVGVIVHEIKPTQNPKHIYKDIILAILGSMVAGLTIIFFYGYTLLGMLSVSLVVGIFLAVVYIIFSSKYHSPLRQTSSES